MDLGQFYREEDNLIVITPEQGSRFAKQVAGDFNPIHDPEGRRFCVPGDLLFALILDRFGLAQRMSCRFHSMVGRDTPLRFEQIEGGPIKVVDTSGKVVLEATTDGGITHDKDAISDFTQRYVSFSGLNFPHYLDPLMQEHNVMFNPDRPLVVYDSMDFATSELAVAGLDLELAGSDLLVEGKRAIAQLQFSIQLSGREVGTGSKKLIISGLRPYDPDVMTSRKEEYHRRKEAFEAAGLVVVSRRFLAGNGPFANDLSTIG